MKLINERRQKRNLSPIKKGLWVWLPMRMHLMWHILQGRPIIYGCHFARGLHLVGDQSHIWVVNNTVIDGGLKEG